MAAVQPCALLLVVGPDWSIATASANLAMIGAGDADAVIGTPLADLIGSDSIHSLRNRVSWLAGDDSEVQDFGVEWGTAKVDVRALREGDRYLVEAEPMVEPRLVDGIGMVRSMSDRLTASDWRDLAEQGMRRLQALTGFECVTMCDGQGERLAVSSDKQAAMPSEAIAAGRLLADRDAAPVPLAGEDHSGLIDRAAFLAPPANQIERLAGHGVAAMMEIPLRIDGELVGSIRATHRSPRRCGAERRSVAHLFAERLAARMARHGWKI